MKRRKRFKFKKNSCPRCGNELKKVTGFKRCEPCGYNEIVSYRPVPDERERDWVTGRVMPCKVE